MHPKEIPAKSNWVDSSHDSWVPLDPWDTGESDQQNDADNWLIGYVDILTLMLTLMVLLLAFNQIESKHSESTRVKSTLEMLQSVAKARQLKVKQARPSSTIQSTANNPVSNRKARVHSSMPPAYKRIADPTIETALPLNNDERGYLPDQNFLAQLHNSALDSLDLSINPVDALGRHFVLPHSLPTVPVLASSLQQKTGKQKKLDISSRTNLEIFQRVISEQNLEGLVDVSQSRNAVRMEVNESILFETGNADLKPGGKQLLDELAIVFRKQLGSIHVEGHTDNVPISTLQYPSNWELSASRASTVARNLIDREISSHRLRAIGFADTKPRYSNKTAQDRSKNRRVSLVIEFDNSNS